MQRHKFHLYVSAVALAAALPFDAAWADSADPVGMAHGAGFLDCDELIAREFQSFSGSADGRIRVDSVQDGRSISMTASFGRPGDNVLQTIIFVRSEKGCSSYAQTFFTWSQSCNATLAEFKDWTVLNTQADTAWATNRVGARGYFKQLTSGGCAQMVLRTGVLELKPKTRNQ